MKRMSVTELEAYLDLLFQIKETQDTINRADFPYREVLDLLPFAVYVTDASRSPVYVNKVAYSALRNLMSRPVDLDNLNAEYGMYIEGTDELFPMNLLPTERVILTKQTEYIEAVEFRNVNRQMIASMLAQPLLDANGEIRYIVVVAWDKYHLRID